VKELLANKLNEQAKKLNKKLTLCRSVKRLLQQKPWKDIIEPLLAKMIEETIGGKSGNMYCQNHLSKPGQSEFFVGYKQALMDLHNRIWAYPESIEGLKKQIKVLEDRAKAPDRYIGVMGE
jgi:hypothetical protein